MIDELIARWSRERATDPAIIDSVGCHTWRELADQTDRLARQIPCAVSGSPVLLVLPQRASGIAALAAFARLQIDVILASRFTGAAQRQAYMAELGATAAVSVEDDGLIRVEPPAPEVATAGAAPLRARGHVRTAGPSIYVLTSGTTGRPKAARHTMDTLCADVRYRESFVGQRWMLGFPLSHFAGLQVVAQCICNAGTLVLPEDFTPRAARAALERHRPVFLNATPTYLRQLLLSSSMDSWSNSSLRSITLGGEITDQRLLDALQLTIPDIKVTHIYASTETGAAIWVRDGRAGFDRTLIDGERLRIVDGELEIRRSSRSMLDQLVPGVSTDWIATGDLVEVDGDRVRFIGRRGDAINTGGFKVPPALVESVIRESGNVREAVVVGHASSLVGHLLKAKLVLVDGADPAAVFREVRELCSARLPRHMVPRLFECIDTVELTPSQKVVRR
jgi:acyl-CoA synthetase (AMP-forming)/AMP-acid ligase II